MKAALRGPCSEEAAPLGMVRARARARARARVRVRVTPGHGAWARAS